ncbi:MAG: cupin [Gemmatimonadetes bacterium]|nr:cupin [Gemmatimonadota bacterium]
MKIVQLGAISDEPVSHNAAIAKRVLLRKGEAGAVTQFAQSRFAPGEVAPAHSHPDMHEVFFVQSGQGTAVVDGVSHELVRGTCITFAPGEVHEISNDGEAELVLLYFGVASGA